MWEALIWKRVAVDKKSTIKAVADQRVAALLEEHTPEVFETHLLNAQVKASVIAEYQVVY
jgi:hypothetical protein